MNICIIPARKNSQRIKGKNIKLFLGQPIISYPIKVLLKSNFFDEIVISSDCKETIKIATSLGVKAYFVRPNYLSGPKVTIKKVVEHTIEHLIKQNKVLDIVACVFPTSVFLDKKLLTKSIETLKIKKSEFVFIASKFASSVERSFLIEKNHKIKKINLKMRNRMSQDTKDYYYDAGQLVIGRKVSWLNKKNKSVISKKSSIIELNTHKAVDINNIDDWKHAEFIFGKYKKNC